MASITIAIDAMSGDHGLTTTIPAVLLALDNESEFQIILVGDKTQINTYLQVHHLTLSDRIRIHHADEVVAMDDLPSHALRSKRDSSMRIAIDLVKTGEADAAVSAGNTGALMAIARFVLKMIPGIERPAIIATLPTISGKPIHMLDLGANVNCSADQLLQFALMGSVMCESIDGIAKPTVCLLNIGAEEIKGNTLVKEAAQLIQQNPQINYQGFIEGDQIFQGEVNVVVCDGFVGNSVLKTAEGVVKMFGRILKDEFKLSFINKLRGLLVKPVFKNAYSRLDPEVYNGSPLLGLQGNVIKSHGSANATAFFHAIHHARLVVEQNLPQRITAGLQTLKQEG